jgi:hypothetical protein
MKRKLNKEQFDKMIKDIEGGRRVSRQRLAASLRYLVEVKISPPRCLSNYLADTIEAMTQEHVQ